MIKVFCEKILQVKNFNQGEICSVGGSEVAKNDRSFSPTARLSSRHHTHTGCHGRTLKLLSLIRCRSQNNFLQAFPSVPVPKTGGVKTTTGGGGGSLLGLWLRLLVNLSFAEDGQQSILKVPGALEVLTDLAQHRRLALLTLHNLCFCPANKPHVIANGMGGTKGLKL